MVLRIVLCIPAAGPCVAAAAPVGQLGWPCRRSQRPSGAAHCSGLTSTPRRTPARAAEQDARFGNKEKKLLKTMKFPAEYSQKVDPAKVNWEVMKPWIAKRVTELLGIEDEVLIAYIYEQLEGKKVGSRRAVGWWWSGGGEGATAGVTRARRAAATRLGSRTSAPGAACRPCRSCLPLALPLLLDASAGD